jgi:hypothetical protein
MTRKAILRSELERRKVIQRIISSTVEKKFIIMEGAMTKRGVVQKVIAEAIGVKQNNLLSKMVIDFMKSEGCTPCILHGRLYFRNITSREFCIETFHFQDERL